MYRLLSIWELGQKARAGNWLELGFPAQGGKAHSDLPPQNPPILGWLIVVLFINLLKDVNRVIVALYDINNLMSPCYLFMEWIMRSLQGPDIILQSGNSTAAIKHTHTNSVLSENWSSEPWWNHCQGRSLQTTGWQRLQPQDQPITSPNFIASCHLRKCTNPIQLLPFPHTSVDWSILNISYTWNHSVCILLHQLLSNHWYSHRLY